MAYKVLGQVTTPGATVTTTVNLVKNPTFEDINISVQSTTTTTASPLSLTAGGTSTYWKITSPSVLSNYAAASAYDVPVSGNGGTDYYALRISRNLSTTTGTHTVSYGTTTAAGGTTPDTSIAIPVTAGTTYYWGAYWTTNSVTATTSPTMNINWYDSSLTALSTSTLSMTNTATTFTRTTTNTVAPTGATWATINLKFTQAVTTGTMNGYWDGIHFSTLSTTNTTFPQPISTTGTSSLFTSPYDAIYINKWSGTPYSSTTVNVDATYSDLYTVPAASSAVVSTISVTNASTTTANYRISVLPSGGTRELKHHIAFNTSILPNETHYYTDGITLASGDKIQVQSENTSIAVSAFGSEN